MHPFPFPERGVRTATRGTDSDPKSLSSDARGSLVPQPRAEASDGGRGFIAASRGSQSGVVFHRRLRSRGPRFGSFAMCTAILFAASLALAARAGIPEPDLVWYGQVHAMSAGENVRVTTGTLVWEIEPAEGGPAWVLSTALTNINDQFSFVLRVPCETPEPGGTPRPEMVSLTTPPTTYRRVTVTLEGQALTLKNSPSQFAPAPNDRGRAERIDLVLGSEPADSDGDGLADAWEMQHFGTLDVTPDGDPDGDGMTNLIEYRAGTHPNDAQSLFAVIEMQPLPEGVRLRWSSQPDRTYKVLRSATLLSGPQEYDVIREGLSATPPLNEYLDAQAVNGSQFFYVVQVED
jgi:hypothetical protein